MFNVMFNTLKFKLLLFEHEPIEIRIGSWDVIKLNERRRVTVDNCTERHSRQKFASKTPTAVRRSIGGGARLRTVPCGEAGDSKRELKWRLEANCRRRVVLRVVVHASTPLFAPFTRIARREGGCLPRDG